jgi:hypothetical protein
LLATLVPFMNGTDQVWSGGPDMMLARCGTLVAAIFFGVGATSAAELVVPSKTHKDKILGSFGSQEVAPTSAHSTDLAGAASAGRKSTSTDAVATTPRASAFASPPYLTSNLP